MVIAERIQQDYTNTKYYQFATILEHMIDCFHTMVSSETNPYHAWLTRKSPKPPDDELFLDLIEECSRQSQESSPFIDNVQLSSSVRNRLEKCPLNVRKEISSRTQDGCSPLFIACKLGLTTIAKYLIEVCQAYIEQRGLYEALKDHHTHSVSPIWVAAVSGHYNTVKLLIEKGANINSLSDTGSTPLRSVCFQCNDDDGTNSQPSSDLGCIFSIEDGEESEDVYLKIIKLLVDNGADVQKPNYNGGTCLVNSLHNYRLTEYIIDKGADVNATGYQSITALHHAIQDGRHEVAKLLISRGANPYLRTYTGDDALQLCCTVGHTEIFNLLIDTFDYHPHRLADAYKLLGSSILEIHYDLPKVRQLWEKSLKVEQTATTSRLIDHQCHETSGKRHTSPINRDKCDIRRSIAYGDISEFTSENELQTLSTDAFRTQSLIISERILGPDHRETIQRLLYRGTFYINALRPDRCIDLWIYALRLRLKYDSIFHFESIFAAQAISKLFLDLFSQHQHHRVKFEDVYDVLTLLVDKLEECIAHLSWKPVSRLHQDIFDLLLEIITNLSLASQCIARLQPDRLEQAREVIRDLVRINPRNSNGSTLLHLCIASSTSESDTYRALSALKSSPVIELIEELIDNGLDIELTNDDGLSALQIICLISMRGTDKRHIVKLLIDRGAHVDRRTPSPEQADLIRQAIRDAGLNPVRYISLSCLAARKLAESKIHFDARVLTKSLNESIAIH